MENFEKLSIGNPDARRVKQILSILEKISEQAAYTKTGIDNILKAKEKEWECFPPNYFFEFVKSAKPEAYLYQLFADVNKITLPGISTEKLISEKLIDIPADMVKELLQDRIKLLSLFPKLENLGYSIRLSDLYDKECEFFIFDPEVFEPKVIEDLTIYTQSESENKALKLIQNLSNSINDLVEFGLLPADQRALKIDFLLNTLFVIDITSERPVSPSPQMFRNSKLKNHASKAGARVATKYDINTLLS